MAKMFCLGAFPKNDLLPSGCRLDQRRAEPDLVHIWMLIVGANNITMSHWHQVINNINIIITLV